MRIHLSMPIRRIGGTLGMAVVILTGCGGPPPSSAVCEMLATSAGEPGEPTHEASGNDVSSNGLQVNGLSFNGIARNAMTFNRLALNRLAFNALTLNGLQVNGLQVNGLQVNGLQVNGLSDERRHAGRHAEGSQAAQALARSREGRTLLRYLVGCALEADQSLTVRVGGDPLVLHGNLGVAPQWLQAGLDEAQERWVSACLLAHVNAYGESVPISVRATGVVEADFVEQTAFPVHEGAFFGSLDEEAWFSCYADPPAWARSMSSDRARRICTDRGSECEIRSVGPCEDVCEVYTPGMGWSSCWANGEVYDEVVNTHLREDALLAECGIE